MKILYVNDYGTPTGGAEMVVLRLREGMRRRGHDARLFSSDASEGAVCLADYQCFGTLSPYRTLLRSANLLAWHRLGTVLEEFRPDVVQVEIFLTQLSPLILPLLREVPAVYHAAWYEAVCPKGTKLLPDGSACCQRAGTACYRSGCLPLRDWGPLMAQRALVRGWMDAFSYIAPVSEAVRAEMELDGIACDGVMPMGVPDRTARGPLSDPPMAFFAGRLVVEKGVDVLLRAFAQTVTRMPEARLTISGDGPEREALGALATELGIGDRVNFAGMLDQRSMEQLAESAWVQVVCSRWAEPFGLVAVEAMMRGTAVIATNRGGLRDIVEGTGGGLLVGPADVGALSAALDAVLTDREYAEVLGAAGRRVALEKYSDAKYLDRFEQLYRKMIADGPRRRGGVVSKL